MPRNHRCERAINHPNPVVGCIMLVQEKIRFLGRALIRCRCPEYEAELAQLREELTELQQTFQSQQDSLRRLQIRSQETIEQYRQRINTLLRANARQITFRRHQLGAVRLEILALKQTIRSMRREIIRLDGNIPEPFYSEWELAWRSPATWVVSSLWQERHPGQVPTTNPNIVQDEPISEVSLESNAPSEPVI